MSNQPGTLTVFAGCMASGKSANFIHRIEWLREKGYEINVCMPAEVDAKLLHAHSRTGGSAYARRFSNARDIERWMNAVDGVNKALAIDEVQDAGLWLVEVIATLLLQGGTIVVAGRETDFRGEPFPIMKQLQLMAESYMVLTAVCVTCGRKAERSQRLVDEMPANWDSPTRERGGPRETYQPRCIAHHEVPGRPSSELHMS